MSRRVDLAILCWQPIPVDRSSLLSKVGALACVLVCLIGSKRGWGEEKQSAAQLFLNEVQPMLKSKCFGCHGEGERLRGGLDLRSRAAMLKGGDSGPALVPGSAEKSLLYQAVLRTGDVVMPPKESARLSENEVRALKRWIDEGAVWPAAQFAGNKQYDPKDVWAYQPITRPRVPSIAGEVKTPIDAFILRKLKQHDLEPAVRADRVTLIRRAYFDLIGLPPTPQEIEAFVADDSPLAFDKVIDRLLASPHYGERMAQHWLDVVRYADTSGFANDFERPHAWRYRDYVIKSFNDDKPYDRFVIEQLAGDELDASNAENLIATGFLRMGPWEHTAMSVAAITRQFYLDDITNNVGVTFLAQALRCARCHDHKFDPVPTRDYYRIQAVFAATQFAEREVPFQRWENTADFANVAADVDRQLGTKIRPLTKENTANTQRMVSVKRDAYYKLARQRTKPLCFSVRSGKPQTVAILERGSLQSPGEVVTPGVLSAVYQSNDAVEPSRWNTIPTDGVGRRLAFARWVASPRNTLTARVMVNRVWQMHFGTGLVATPNNFGKTGARPSHPDLLDWLATWFIEHGWSIKQLHALIMKSAVYQRASTHPDMANVRKLDARNAGLSYFPPRRLSAEEIRDTMLAVTGELSQAMGGPGIFPVINEDVAVQPRHIMGGIAPIYQPSPRPEQRNRRTIYAFRYRGLADPMLEVFNKPGSESSCERREETTVTPQVFALFNSQFVHDRALAFAARLFREENTMPARIDRAFALAFGRSPTAEERQRCLAHVQQMIEHHRRHPPKKVERPKKLVRTMVAEMTGETFSWERRSTQLTSPT